jgi:hypothetical protein
MSAWQEIKALHAASTRGAKEGVAFRYFSRPLASLILYFIKDGRVTPNQVTILSLLVATVGSVVHVTILNWYGLVAGGALFMGAHVLDALDGQLARHRKAGSVIGMYFDFFIDELKAYFVYCAVAIRLYRQARLGIDGPVLRHMLEWIQPQHIVIAALAGLCALAIGISCTQFYKRQEWKDAFPASVGIGGPKSGAASLVALIEKGGKFVIDYPSYIVILCLLNAVEVYFAGYTIVVILYAIRALGGISLRLWRVNPYQRPAA